MIIMKVLINNAWVLTCDENWTEYKNGYIYIEDGVIVDTGNDVETVKGYLNKADTIHDAKNQWVMPGMINAHAHLFQSFMRGLADDKPLMRWLKEVTYPFCSAAEPEDFYLSNLLSCVENLENGATSVINQHYVHTSPENSPNVFRAMEETGIRGYNCRTFNNNSPQKDLIEDKSTILYETERMRTEWHGKDNGRLQLMLGPINPWSCSLDLFQESFAYAEEHDLLYQIHTAETQNVVNATLEKFGKRNVELLDSLGMMSPRTQLAHAVWLDEAEMQTVKDSGAMVVHNAVCNMFMGSGVAPIPEYLEMGVPVALATDGAGSNNSNDMMETLKATALLHKLNKMDPTVLYPEDVLRMALQGGAHALGRDDIGMIKPGFKADLIGINHQKTHIQPVHYPNSAIVYNVNGNDVENVWVDGKQVVRDRKSTLVDEYALMEICQQRADYLYKKIQEQ